MILAAFLCCYLWKDATMKICKNLLILSVGWWEKTSTKCHNGEQNHRNFTELLSPLFWISWTSRTKKHDILTDFSASSPHFLDINYCANGHVRSLPPQISSSIFNYARQIGPSTSPNTSSKSRLKPSSLKSSWQSIPLVTGSGYGW